MLHRKGSSRSSTSSARGEAAEVFESLVQSALQESQEEEEEEGQVSAAPGVVDAEGKAVACPGAMPATVPVTTSACEPVEEEYGHEEQVEHDQGSDVPL